MQVVAAAWIPSLAPYAVGVAIKNFFLKKKNLVGHQAYASVVWGALKPWLTPFSPPDELQPELMTTRHLLGELGIGSSEENMKALDLLNELKEVTQMKDLELRRYCRKYCKKKKSSRCGSAG